jgi:hypothetical protein
MEVLVCVDATSDKRGRICHLGAVIPSRDWLGGGTHIPTTDRTVIGLRHELLLGHVRQTACAGGALLTRPTDRFKDIPFGSRSICRSDRVSGTPPLH